MKRTTALLTVASAGGLFSNVSYAQALPPSACPARLGLVGEAIDVQPPVQGGVVLMGGGTNVNAALRWMIKRSGGGDVVVLSSSLTQPNAAIFKLGGVNSVETLRIDSRALADDERTAQAIRNAEMVFIGGGKQSEYVSFWKGTKTMAALNYLLTEKHAPVGGTSAGCAILGQLYFAAQNGSAVSPDSLRNPYDRHIDIGRDDFLHPPFLDQTITDTHYLARQRQGRHLAFLARIAQDWKIAAKGIGVDEGTAVCVDENGLAQVMGASKAYFLLSSSQRFPESCLPNQPLSWNDKHRAVSVYELAQLATGQFDVANWKPEKAAGGKWLWWWAEKGEFSTAPQGEAPPIH